MLGSGSKVCVRSGKSADAAALSRVFRESWLFAYRGIIPHLHLDSMIRQRTPEWWRSAVRSGDSVLVLELAGKLVGYATFGSARQRGPFQGEIYELYLDPVCQGLGFGEHLFEGCRHALDMRKLQRPHRVGAARQHAGLRLLLAARRPAGDERLHQDRRREAGEGRLRLALNFRFGPSRTCATLCAGSLTLLYRPSGKRSGA